MTIQENEKTPDIAPEREMLSKLCRDPEAFKSMPMAAIELDPPIGSYKRVIICGVDQEDVEQYSEFSGSYKRRKIIIPIPDSKWSLVKVEVTPNVVYKSPRLTAPVELAQSSGQQDDQVTLLNINLLSGYCPEVTAGIMSMSSTATANRNQDSRICFQHSDAIHEQILDSIGEEKRLSAQDATLIVLPFADLDPKRRDFQGLFPQEIGAIIYVRDEKLEEI